MSAAATSPLVVAGVDGSDLSMEALRWADHYAAASGGSVRIVVAWERPALYGDTASLHVGFDPAADAARIGEKARGQATLPAERVDVSIVEGSPRAVLMEAAKGADLLVLGAKGHSALAALMLGSVSSYCVQHSPVPVVVAR